MSQKRVILWREHRLFIHHKDLYVSIELSKFPNDYKQEVGNIEFDTFTGKKTEPEKP